MNRPRIRPARSARREERLSPLERINEFLERDSGASKAEIIRVMREALFADVEALQRTGAVKVPGCT